MKKINLRESLIKMDIDTDCKYDLTSLYESCRLDEKKKQELVKFVNDYDIDATNALLTNEASNQGLMEKVSDDLSDEELKDFNLDNEDINVEVLEESGDYQVVCRLKNDQDDICSEHDNLDDAIKAGKEELKSFDDVIVRDTKTGEEKQLNESEQDMLIKNDVINWLQDHETAWSDITRYFHTEDIEAIELDEILGWIADHDTLYSDFQRFFDINLDEDLDEGVLGDIGKVAKAAGKEIVNKTGLTKAYNNSKLKTKVDNVKNKINNSDTMKTLKDTDTFKRIKDAKDVRDVQYNIKAARSPEEIEVVTQQIQALQKDGKLHTNSHMSYLTRQLNDRKKQLGIKDVKKRVF